MKHIFSYGMLQIETVQLSLWGCIKIGEPALLWGYELGTYSEHDASPKCVYEKTGGMVEGIVYFLDDKELARTDEFEGSYKRIKAIVMDNVGNDITADVYVHPTIKKIDRKHPCSECGEETKTYTTASADQHYCGNKECTMWARVPYAVK